MRVLPSVVVYLILSVFSFSALAAEKYMYNYGGSGDSPTEGNMFTDSFVDLINSGKSNGWHIQTLFDGEHAHAAERLRNETATAFAPFTPQNFSNSLRQIQNDLKAGKIKPGDEVMINVITHGRSDNGITNGNPDPSHLVDCGNTTCSLGQLEPVLKALEEKGVKVALVDHSCYSGRSMDFRNSKICVISSTTEDDVGWLNFDQEFQKNLRSGVSLEDVFLTARHSPKSIGSAQISSRAGMLTQAMIDDLGQESRFQLPNIDDMKSVPIQKPCDLQQIHSSLRKTIAQFRDVQMTAALNNYVQATQEYQAIYKKAQSLARQYNSYASRTSKDGSFTASWGQWELFDNDSAHKNYPQMAAHVDELKKNPDFQKMLTIKKSYDEIINTDDIHFDRTQNRSVANSAFSKAALKVQESQKALYDLLYQKNKSAEGNACANFKF